MEVGKCGARDVDTLGVGAGVRGGEKETGVVEYVVKEADIRRSETFEEFARTEDHAEPETFGARAGEEGAAGEAFGVDIIGEVEVAYIADVFDVADKKWNDSTVEIEQAETFIVDKVGDREIAREGFAGETAYDDLFVGGGHGEDYCSGGLSHGVGGRNEKGAERVVILPLLC